MYWGGGGGGEGPFRDLKTNDFIMTKATGIFLFDLIFFNHSLFNILFLYWKVCISVCLAHMKGILNIILQKLSSLFLKFI